MLVISLKCDQPKCQERVDCPTTAGHDGSIPAVHFGHTGQDPVAGWVEGTFEAPDGWTGERSAKHFCPNHASSSA